MFVQTIDVLLLMKDKLFKEKKTLCIETVKRAIKMQYGF